MLGGCSTLDNQFSQQPQSVLSQEDAIYSAKQYLQMADSAPAPQRQQYQLQASNKLLQNNLTSQASHTLSQVDNNALTPQLSFEKELLNAKLALLQRAPRRATEHLKRATSYMNPNQAEAALQIAYYQLAAESYERMTLPLEGAQQRIQLASLLTTADARKQNDQSIWNDLEGLSPNQLQNAMSATAPGSELFGWLDLAAITKNNSRQSSQLMTQVNQWQQQFPTHPANELLSSGLKDNLTAANTSDVKQIALLLPTSGKWSGASEAVRNGVFEAYYQDRDAGKVQANITVYNTSQGDVWQVYQQAVNNGAQVVIGPLTKDNVKALASHHNLTVPVVALNALDKANNAPKGLYQFALSPSDEATQAAQKAWQDGHSQIITIYPQGNWGESINQIFTQQWQNMGGKVVTSLSFPPNERLSSSIEQLLDVNQSNSRSNQLNSILGEKVKTMPRRREDVDAIFLVASPQAAREIRPLLKFYFAGNVPVYAISSIYNGIVQPRENRDLDGILFCDMPWVLSHSSSITNDKRQAQQLWPSNYRRYPKLYAFGMDAYSITRQLNRMTALPQLGIKGRTGTLSMDNQGVVHRQLQWAKMQNGMPRQVRS